MRKPHTRDNEMRATSASAIAVSESTGMTPEQLVNNVFLGDGVHISNVKFNGVNTALTTTNGAQLGTFTADVTGYTFPTNFFENGLIMTTGKIATALGPNDTDSESNQLGSYEPPACSELDSLIPDYEVNKPAVLEFDFVTVSDHISFNYVFASEEYPEWAGSSYNDVFGFFVTDMVTNTTQNIALIPGTNIPVAINNIHSATGSSYTSVAAYEQYYHSIPSNSPLMQYDAYVGPFVAEMDVVPCRNYHMKLAIANVGDNSYDSGVFLEAASFSASVLNEVVDFEYTGHQYIVAGCFGADVTFTLPHAVENDSIIVLHYSGTAVNGVNLELLPDIIEMPAGDSTYTLHISGIDNGQHHNDTLILTIQYENSVCTTVQEGKIDIYIVQDSGLELSSQNISTCGNLNSMSVNVVYGEATNIQWSPATNLTNPHSLTTGFINPPTGTTQYTVTASDKYGCKTASTTFTVTIIEQEDENITEHVCQGTHYTDHGFNINANTPGTITQSTEVSTPGSDCSHTLNLTLIVDPTPEQTITKTFCDSYTWEDGTQIEYTQSGIYDFVTQTTSGCDSIVHLDLTINESKTNEFNAEACNTYTWDGTVYDTPGDKVRTYLTAQGCDSIVTMHLTLGHTITNEFSRTECDSYTWDGTEYTTSNDYVKQYVSYEGCDSIVTMHLTINNSTTGIDTQEHCDSYTWIDGVTYTASNNTATKTLTNAAGCDSVVTLNLTINYSTTGIDTQEHCDSYTWIDGVTYTASNNTATKTLTNAAGCDSVVTLNLTIKNSTTGIDTQVHCDSYTWIDGVTYTASNNTATKTLTNAAGCDSVVTLNLTINNANTGIDTQEHCDSYTWIDGVTYTASNNTATKTLTNAAGCDSVVTLNLTINYSDNTGSVTETVCDSYTWNGQTYTQTGVYTYPTQTVHGCDSTATLNLTVNNSNTGIDTQEHCDSYTWIDGVTYTASNNTATKILTNAAGCDSVVTLNLTINYSEYPEETHEACETYTWHGQEYSTSGTYTYEDVTEHGCARIETLHLTISYPEYPEFTETACDSYVWNGTTYTNSGTYTYETTTTAGCIRNETLYLTVNHSDESTTEITECDNYFWNGVNYTQSGQYQYLTQTVLGCDSVAHLNLTINNSEYPVENIHYCDNYLWNGQEYNHSGTYTYETQTAAGCERIETLNLTIVETPDIVIEGSHFPIGGSETNFSVYNYEIVPQNSSTVFDSVVWHMDNINWYIDPHNNGMDVDLHIFTWIPDTVQLIATAYNECGSHTYTFWIHTSYYDIDENSQGNSINILPNPNNGKMNFEFNDFKGEAMVKVFDNNGNLVETFNIDRKNFRYEMAPKASGTYHFVITHDGKVTTKRIVIVK